MVGMDKKVKYNVERLFYDNYRVTTELSEVYAQGEHGLKLYQHKDDANKDCESATLEVSSQGLSRIKFEIDNYDSEYFLVSTQAVN